MVAIMKKLALLFLLLPSLLVGGNLSTELRVGYFYPSSHVVRDIYRRGGVEPEIELSARFCQNWLLWANGNMFLRRGSSIGGGNRTWLHVFPLSLGVKYELPMTDCSAFQLGIGASYTTIDIHDDIANDDNHFWRNLWGVVGKSSFVYYFNETFYSDLFLDYYYTRTSHHQPLNMGGLRTGLGVGINF